MAAADSQLLPKPRTGAQYTGALADRAAKVGIEHAVTVSLPPSPARPSRLSGLAAALVFVALLAAPSEAWPAGRTAVGAVPAWTWPVAPPHPVVRPFIAPATPYAAGHRGIDIAAAAGTAVVAPADGVVHFAGTVVDRPVLSLRHPDGVISSFEPVTSDLREGDAVSRGTTVGTLEPGHCADPACLHFGVRVHGEYVSPLLFLGGIEPSVLLPTRRI